MSADMATELSATPQEPKKIVSESKDLQEQVRFVTLDEIKIDPRYQREYKSKRAEAIGRNWNDNLAGFVTLSEREDGTYAVDGQHRTRGAVIAGKKGLWAIVHTGLSVEQEAELFDRLNTGRSYVSALERFRARLLYKDPEAVEINSIVEELGGKIAERTGRKNSGDTAIRSITSLERVYKAGGPALLNEVLKVIKEAWGSLDYETTNEYTISGIRQFIARQPKGDRARLIERLTNEGYGQIRRMAHAHSQIFGGSGPMNFYRACVEAYNKHLTPRHRLRP